MPHALRCFIICQPSIIVLAKYLCDACNRIPCHVPSQVWPAIFGISYWWEFPTWSSFSICYGFACCLCLGFGFSCNSTLIVHTQSCLPLPLFPPSRTHNGEPVNPATTMATAELQFPLCARLEILKNVYWTTIYVRCSHVPTDLSLPPFPSSLRAAGNQNKLWNHIPYATAMNRLHPFPHSALKVEISSDSQQMFSPPWKLILRNILCSIDLHNTPRGRRKFWIVFAVIIQNTLRVFFNSTSSVLSSLVSINYSSMAETINMLPLKHNSPDGAFSRASLCSVLCS